MDKINELKQKISDFQAKSAAKDEIVAFTKIVLELLKVSKNDFNNLSAENKKTIKDSIAYIEQNYQNSIDTIKGEKNSMVSEFEANIALLKDLIRKVKTIKPIDGKDGIDGKNPDPKDVVHLVLKALPKVKELDGEDIANKLETLKGEKRLDASAIKNLPEFVENASQGSGFRNVFHDSSMTGTGTAADPLVVVGGGGTIDGSGTTNELTYWVDSNTIGALAVATYPSLTELSYVKGLTSSAQTQITAKAPSTSPTFATSITGSYLTASEMLITDGSKNIVSAGVATYPSLTELTYLKGVTSAIQTQLNAKGIGDVTKVGTPVNNQIGVWTGNGTIEGDANFTWDGATNTILGNSLLSKTGTATVGTQTYNSNEYKLQGSQWFTSGSVAKTLTGGMTIKPRNPGAIVTSTLDFGYAIDSSTERPVISYKVGDHYNDGFAGQLTLRSGYWDGSGSFATGYGSTFGGTIETQYDGTFAFRPVGASGTDFSGMRALSFGTHTTYASFWSRWGYGGGAVYDADIRTSFNGSINIGAGLPDWISAGTGASGSELLNVTIDQVITGNDATRPALKIIKTTEQTRVCYDTSNYFKTTINSTGSATLDLVGTSPNFTFSDPVLLINLVEANTAGVGSPNIITAGESNTVYTNEGAVAKNYHTLPTAVAGYTFTFIVQDADGMRIVGNTGDTIRLAGVVSGAAGYTESTTIGSTVTLTSINATEWVATSIIGTWVTI